MRRACSFCGGSHRVGEECPLWRSRQDSADVMRDRESRWHVNRRPLTREHRAFKAHLIKEVGRCMWTGCEETRNLELDHVVPVADGGETDLSNLQLLCRPHHRRKGMADRKRRRDAEKARSYRGLTGGRANPDA